MPWSRLDILNLAFNKLNKASVQDIANAGEFAAAADATFDLLYPSAISGKSWRFATKLQQLNVLITPPIIDTWTYALQLPSDYLAAVRTWPVMSFQIYQDQMYANNNIVTLEYRYLVNVTHLPVYFVHYLAVLIAAWFADTVAENEKLSSKLAEEAQIQLGEALFTDSQSHPIPAMNNNPLIQARQGTWRDWDRPPNN
jgi:hypothetical protein